MGRFININSLPNRMFNKNMKKYSNAFVFGTGGGNDIVSAVLVALYLQKQGVKTDVGGVLSPAAIHTFEGNLEKAVNNIQGEVKRFIPSKNNIEISFVDSHLPGFVNQSKVNIEDFYDFSIRYGTNKLVENVNELVKDKNYDLVVAVDVGGDILARGKKDNTLLSPVMDFTSLYLLKHLNVDSLLIEFGLGTDGELRSPGMQEILNELRDKQLLLHESYIQNSDPEVKVFEEIFEKVGKIRRGHTAVMTLETLKKINSQEDIVSLYRFRSQIAKKKWFSPYEVVLPHEYFGKVFFIDGKGLAKERQETAFSYENSLEQYVKLKKTQSWKTELDLFYLWSGDDWKSADKKGECMLLLAPSTLIPTSDRIEMFKEGVNCLNNNYCDLALVLTDDLNYIKEEKVINAGKYSLIYTNKCNFAKETACRIKEYQK